MSEITVLAAEPREGTGTGPARALRRLAKVPAIIYGGHAAPVKVAVGLKEMKKELSTNPRFFTSVLELDFGDRKERVLPREAQLHPVSDEPLHVDFLRAEGGAELTVEVPVRFINDEKSGIKRGGVLNIVRREIELVCPADAIPEEIVIDLEGFDIGDSIHISRVTLPANVRPTITDRDFTVASIVPPTVVPESTEEEGGTEGETPAAG